MAQEPVMCTSAGTSNCEANTAPRLAGGVCFLTTGDAVFINDGVFGTEEPPLGNLGKAVNVLVEQAEVGGVAQEVFDVAAVREWTKLDPPPSDGARDIWFQNLSSIAVRSGLHLLWRGKLVTANPDLAKVVAALQSCCSVVSRLAWPPETSIEMLVIGEHGVISSCRRNWGDIASIARAASPATTSPLDITYKAEQTSSEQSSLYKEATDVLIEGLVRLLTPFNKKGESPANEEEFVAIRAFFVGANDFVTFCCASTAELLFRHSPLPETRLTPLRELANRVRAEVFGRLEDLVRASQSSDNAAVADVTAAIERSQSVSAVQSAVAGAVAGFGAGRLINRGLEGAIVGATFGATDAPLEALDQSFMAAQVATTARMEIEETVRACFAELANLPETLMKRLAANCYGATTDFSEMSRAVSRCQQFVNKRLVKARDNFEALVKLKECEIDAAMKEVEKAYDDVEASLTFRHTGRLAKSAQTPERLTATTPDGQFRLGCSGVLSLIAIIAGVVLLFAAIIEFGAGSVDENELKDSAMIATIWVVAGGGILFGRHQMHRKEKQKTIERDRRNPGKQG